MIDVINVEETEHIAIASFKVEITHSNIGILRGESLSEQILDKTERKKIIFNLKNVQFIDSILLGRIMGLYRTMAEKDGVLVLSSLNEEVLNLIKQIQLDTIINIYLTEDEAVKKLSA